MKLLEREIGSRTGTLPIAQWLARLDRIEQAAARMGTPASYASEAYTFARALPPRCVEASPLKGWPPPERL